MKDEKQGKTNKTKEKDAVKDVKADKKEGEPSAKKAEFPTELNDEIMAELMCENDDNDLNKLPKLIQKVNLFLQMPDE